MSTLRMNIEEVRNLSQQLKYTAAEMDQLGNSIKSDLARLNWAWQGPEAGRFRSDLKRWLNDYRQQTEILEYLANSVRREVDEWEQVDHRNVFEPRWFNLPWQVLDWIKGINWPDIHLPRLPWLFPFFPLLPWLPFIPELLPGITWPPKIDFRPPQFPIPDWFPALEKSGDIQPEHQPNKTQTVTESDGRQNISSHSQPVVSKQPTSESLQIHENAPIDDCVDFVKDHRNVPSGFNDNVFYSGEFKGQSGTLEGGTRYGQEPQLGSIMVESPNDNVGISYGHASYVYEVTRDESGNITAYKIAEGNWDPDKIHYETFTFDKATQSYVSSKGTRSPDIFIY